MEVTVKKLLSFVILCAGLLLPNMTFPAYQPATGPLTFVDRHPNRGAIMQIVVDNNPAVVGANHLSAANTVIAQLDGNGQNFSTYQQIIDKLRQTTNNDLANNVVEAFETVIMHMYDYRIYILGGYNRWQSIIATGIHSPLSYFSSQKTAECKQMIDELAKLAEIVEPHNKITSLRIQATVQSYRHWRRNIALACAAYLAADAHQNGIEKSTAYLLYEKGLSNAPSIVWNGLKNNFAWTKASISLAGGGIYGAWKYGVKPAAKAVLWGAEAFEEKTPDAKKSQTGWLSGLFSSSSKDTVSSNEVPLTATNYLKDTWTSYLETFSKKKVILSDNSAMPAIIDNGYSSSTKYIALPAATALGLAGIYYLYQRLLQPAAQGVGAAILPAGINGGAAALAPAPPIIPALVHIVPVAPTILQARQAAQTSLTQAQAAQAQAQIAIANPGIGANIVVAQTLLAEIQPTIARTQAAVGSAQAALTLAQAQAAQAEAQATTEFIIALTDLIEITQGRANPAPATLGIIAQVQAIQAQNQVALQAAQAAAATNQRAIAANQRCLYAQGLSDRGAQRILANQNIPNIMEVLALMQALANEAYAAALSAEAA